MLERWRHEHPRKEEKPSEAELDVMNCPGEFYFAMETCVPTAAPISAAMNRLWGWEDAMTSRATSRDIGVHPILFSSNSRFIVRDDRGTKQ